MEEVGNKLIQGPLPPGLEGASCAKVAKSVLHLPIMPLADLEKAYLQHALDKFQGNIMKTAAALRIGRATMYRKVDFYKLETEEEGWSFDYEGEIPKNVSRVHYDIIVCPGRSLGELTASMHPTDCSTCKGQYYITVGATFTFFDGTQEYRRIKGDS